MNMKKLLESMDRIEECGTNEGMPMVPPMPQEDKGNPVSMNVSLNASGKDHVEDLINMMKNAGMGGAKEVAPDMMPMRTDMERLRDIVDGPKDMDDLKPGIQKEPCPKCGKMHIGASNCMDSIEEGGMSDKAIEIEEWIKKYETRIGNNGDTLPEGYVKYFMDSGIFSDAYEQNETAKAEKMIGKPYTEWEYDDQEKALEMMPITSAMFDEIEKITGTSGEDAAEMVSDVMNGMDEGYNKAVEEGAFDGKSREELLKMKAEAEAWFKKNPGGIGSHADGTADFMKDTEQMQMQQHLKDIEAALEKVGEGYDNEPGEQYGSIDDVINSGNDLHKSKKAYAATQDGDNPMALKDDIKEQLYKAIQAKMAEGRGRGKKKAKEDIQTTEGRGRGKSKKVKEGECPKCGKPGKKKLMACSSCGCS